ncbi:MAG: hypothetical protein Q7J54_04810 [Candidatus Woesearchaeota archaeon]|nr:hypothetical protein [Candidatus Woesearchaeota archaeon]
MKEEKHDETLKEVLDEIEAALKDPRGLLAHQRRLAFSLSLGATNLLELHFHKLSIIKEGSKINHLWFKKKKEKVLGYLQKQIISPINSVQDIDKVIEMAIKIEEKRDDLAYGAPATERALQEKINLFFEFKKMLKC